ncbi:helix-turn-helix domain-containing protein [Sphingobacterium multivorum]|uniref:helix-turn-helix domain-containing protein n=1 Tax=Sphingobacterium multivorum TaxID=28454 RepID=UPI00345E2E65
MTPKDVVFHSLHDLFKMIDKVGHHNNSNDDFFIIKDSHELDQNDYQYPFRTDSTVIFLITDGEARFQINLEMIDIKKDDILIITRNSIVYPAKKEAYLRVKGIVFNDSFFQKNILNMHQINEIIFLSGKNKAVLLSGYNEGETLGFLFGKIKLASEQQNYYSKDIVKQYFNVLLLELMSLYRRGDRRVMDTKSSRKKDLINQFLVLLSEHCKTQRAVEFYAERLFVTPNYLTHIVKEASGETTRDIITNSVIMEARDMLLYSDLSISQIAGKLNFSDQSFFGKFFKKKMKMSPKLFRSKHK